MRGECRSIVYSRAVLLFVIVDISFGESQSRTEKRAWGQNCRPSVYSRAALLFFVVAFLTFMSIAAFPAFIEVIFPLITRNGLLMIIEVMAPRLAEET